MKTKFVWVVMTLGNRLEDIGPETLAVFDHNPTEKEIEDVARKEHESVFTEEGDPEFDMVEFEEYNGEIDVVKMPLLTK